MENTEAEKILEKYLLGEANDKEKAIIEAWYNKIEVENRTELTPELREIQLEEIRNSLPGEPHHYKINYWSKISAVAAMLLFVGGTVLYYNSYYSGKDKKLVASYSNDVAAGKTGATLTLANGKKILITDVSTGNIASQSGVKISKTATGEIIYEVLDNNPEVLEYNTLSTTKGEQTQIRLPDGTVVFLNAASSLKYPASFAKSKERNVELQGEGYFEVAKDKEHPFIIKTTQQTVRVLGTHFNVNAYSDEPDTKTTLLEGSVKVSAKGSSVTIKPGEQASLKDNNISISEVNVNSAIDWKEGKFRFKNESLTSILRKISRWYDVKIIYQRDQQEIPSFSGSVSRAEPISSVLKMLQETSDVSFLIEGKIIRVK